MANDSKLCQVIRTECEQGAALIYALTIKGSQNEGEKRTGWIVIPIILRYKIPLVIVCCQCTFILKLLKLNKYHAYFQVLVKTKW